MSTVQWENTAVTQIVSGKDWHSLKGYRLHILLTKDEDAPDSFSAVVLNLPGAGSCGATEEEALENVKEAVRGVLEEYESSSRDIPWKDSSVVGIPPGAKQKWIILDA